MMFNVNTGKCTPQLILSVSIARVPDRCGGVSGRCAFPCYTVTSLTRVSRPARQHIAESHLITQHKHHKLWAVATLVLALGVAHAAINVRASHAEPAISSSSPQDGAVLATPPELLNLCFSEPVQTEGEDAWRFAVKPNGSSSLGLRIVFLPDGTCVDVFPGAPDPFPHGIWNFEWFVKATSDSSEGSGIVNFQVGELLPGQTPLPASESPSGGDDSTPPVALIALIITGVLIVLVGVTGFSLRLRRRKA